MTGRPWTDCAALHCDDKNYQAMEFQERKLKSIVSSRRHEMLHLLGVYPYEPFTTISVPSNSEYQIR